MKNLKLVSKKIGSLNRKKGIIFKDDNMNEKEWLMNVFDIIGPVMKS